MKDLDTDLVDDFFQFRHFGLGLVHLGPRGNEFIQGIDDRRKGMGRRMLVLNFARNDQRLVIFRPCRLPRLDQGGFPGPSFSLDRHECATTLSTVQ